MSRNADPLKQVRINLGAVKRLAKEVTMCQQEFEEAKGNVESSTHEEGSYEKKHLIDLRDEAESSLNDVKKRLADFQKKLQAAISAVGDDFAENELIVEAKGLLK